MFRHRHRGFRHSGRRHSFGRGGRSRSRRTYRYHGSRGGISLR